MTEALLEVQDLYVEFRSGGGTVRAVNGVSFSLARGETLAVLGESGSGKSVTAAAIMDIIDSPPGFIRGGRILYAGRDLLTLPRRARRRINGVDIGMVFQDALIALNPVYSVGWQISEVLRAHQRASRRMARAAAIHLLERVGIAAAANRVDDYPHQFSGGQRQRVMIAMALALKPAILIADEPTTALDVTVQAQIMDLLSELQNETAMGLLLITHDLGVVADAADRVAVMYAGRVVEAAPVRQIFQHPAHPYTLGLLHSLPRSDRKGDKLNPIRGAPPDLARIPPGCPFHPRCDFALERCRSELPVLRDSGPEHRVACHRSEEILHVSR
ncbi:MAG: ABC transporter ATP-binding protein [Gammaproteobacteria bacterium]